MTESTTEGDPITSHYRVTSGDVLEVYVDGSKDSFSDKTWHVEHVSCTHHPDDVSAQLCAARTSG